MMNRWMGRRENRCRLDGGKDLGKGEAERKRKRAKCRWGSSRQMKKSVGDEKPSCCLCCCC